MKEIGNGCIECEYFWQIGNGQRPEELETNYVNQTILYQCPDCGVFWEENQHSAKIINVELVSKNYKIDVREDIQFHNEIDRKIYQSKIGESSIEDLVLYMLNKEVILPSVTKCASDGRNFRPLIAEINHEECFVIFTDMEKIRGFEDAIVDMLLLPLSEVIKKSDMGLGMIANPRSDYCFQINIGGLGKIKDDFLF